MPGYLSSAFINAVEPPRGLDPRRHHTNTAANLSAAVELLSIPGSRTPKVMNGPQPGHPTNTATTSAAGNGPENARKDGAPENQVHPATPEFLAAAAAKFYTWTAEELVDALVPIVPDIAACRGHWKSKFWAGSTILVNENPASLKVAMTIWRDASGAPSLTAKEIDAIIALLAKIIKSKAVNPQLAEPWIVVARDEFPGHELPPISRHYG